MQPTLKDDPNYLVMGVNEYFELSNKLTERAGVLIGIVAVIITSILLLKIDKSVDVMNAVYQFYVSLLFFALSGFFYARAFLRNDTFIPMHYILKKAQEEQLGLANPAQDLPNLVNLFTKAQDNYEAKQKSMVNAHSFLIASVFTEAFVFILPPHALRAHLHTHPLFAAGTLIVIAFLLMFVCKSTIFAAKREQFGFNFSIREKIQFTRDYDSFVKRMSQQGQQPIQTMVPITPINNPQGQPQVMVSFTQPPPTSATEQLGQPQNEPSSDSGSATDNVN